MNICCSSRSKEEEEEEEDDNQRGKKCSLLAFFSSSSFKIESKKIQSHYKRPLFISIRSIVQIDSIYVRMRID